MFCLPVYTAYASRRLVVGSKPLGTGVMDNRCKLPCVFLEPNPGPLQDQHVFLNC